MYIDPTERGVGSLREITIAQALNEALREEMIRDERVFLMGEDIGEYGGIFKVTKDLVDQFGIDRVRDTPISEAGFIGAGIGAAMTGKIPIIEIMWIDFMAVAMDQIINQSAKMMYMSGGRTPVPLVIRTQGGAGRGNGAQHSQSLETLFAHIPGLKVVAPSTPYDAKGLLKSSIRDPGPVIFIENKMMYNKKGQVPDDEVLVPLGKADVKRAGKDITLISLSRMVDLSLEAAEQLQQEGISCEVIDLRTLNPLDEETILASIRKTMHAVVVYESTRSFGWGAEVCSLLQEKAFDYLDAPILRVATRDVPLPYNRALEKQTIPQAADIVLAARSSLGGGPA
jgi:pyruvate dehydrogenase E1 component beta subunit